MAIILSNSFLFSCTTSDLTSENALYPTQATVGDDGDVPPPDPEEDDEEEAEENNGEN